MILNVSGMNRWSDVHKTYKCYTDMMIAATAKAGNHVVVTRNAKHFNLLLPKNKIANWIDDKP